MRGFFIYLLAQGINKNRFVNKCSIMCKMWCFGKIHDNLRTETFKQQ